MLLLPWESVGLVARDRQLGLVLRTGWIGIPDGARIIV